MSYYEDDLIALHHGDALAVSATLPSASVQTIITSPPYFGLRDYGEAEQIGAEASLGEYVDRMVRLFRELRRVLADDGTLWLNLGDSFASGSRTSYAFDPKLPERAHLRPISDLPAKNLLGVPWRVAFALQDDGWILRSDIIWHKPNPMPESVLDRPTNSHEHLFLLAKSPRYFYDAEAIAEPVVGSQSDRALSFARAGKEADVPGQSMKQKRIDRPGPKGDTSTRNKRDVWTVSPIPFPGAHFAVYPPELIRPCILAGSRPGDTVLDPFSGSGTTGMVATQERRKYVGIDLNRDYLDLSLRERFQSPPLNFGDGAA